MRHFPIFLDLSGRDVLVLGSGEVAERKAAPLVRAGARVRHAPRFDPKDLHGCALAVGGGADEDDLQALSAAARAAGIPVNIVDRPELCSFISPAIVERDPITIAISSAGTAPVLARLLRARIEAAVPPAFGRLAFIADSFKTAFRARFPDLAQRRRVLEHLLAGRAADLVFAGREDEAQAAFAAALEGEIAAAGVVYLAGSGPGEADLVTLRTQRLLGEADLIAYTDPVCAAAADLGRRDASRMTPAHLPDVLAQAAAGAKIVWLLPGDGRGEAAALSAALAAAQVLHEAVPGVA